MTRTLLYGGSFDPPHIAHIRLPHDAMKLLGFDKVIYVPAFQSPLKEAPRTSDAHRLAMLKLALADCDWAVISAIELERGGTSYTIDTIESLQEDEGELRLLIGADQWKQLKQWKRWEDIVRIANPVVLPREGFNVIDERVLPVEPLPEVSTDIRTRIRKGMSIDSFVPPQVSSYIAQHRLYQ